LSGTIFTSFRFFKKEKGMKLVFTLFVILIMLTSCSNYKSGFVPLDKLPEQYFWQNANEDGVLIYFLDASPANLEAYDDFIEKVEAGKRAFIRIMYAYGNTEIKDVDFNGRSFTVTTDLTRLQGGRFRGEPGAIEFTTETYTLEEWEELRNFIFHH
jgi:hypothetical protein